MRLASCLIALIAIGCDTPPLSASCAGQRVMLCGPYEYSEVRAASLEPSELVIADFSMRAQIHVELARCDAAPADHSVDLSAIVPAADAGGAVQVMSLLTLRDGMDGDPVPGDGIIDVDVANPFIATVPAQSDVMLRFTSRSTAPAGCTGASLEVPYRTGPARP